MAETVPRENELRGADVLDCAKTVTATVTSTPPMRASEQGLHIGELLGGRYRLLHEIGRGAEGTVYRALDVTADVVVALKILESEGPERMRRLRRELKVARRVTHPNVVRLYDLIQLPGLVGLSMELVEGEGLERRLARDGALSGSGLLSLAHDLARGLAAAHAAGVTHRDLKPANVILRADGTGATITDFGIARIHRVAVEAAQTGDLPPTSGLLTARGALVGTPLYMAPEQLQGRTDIGPAADVYAFGLVVHEAATLGCLDDDVKNIDELQQRRSRPRPPFVARPELPPALARVIERCLATAPEERYANGGELARALGLDTTPTRPGWWSLAVASGVALLAIGLFAWRSRLVKNVAAGLAPPLPHPFGMHVGAAKRITFGECDEYPSFTHDGLHVVYDSTEGKNSNVQVVDLRDGSTRRLTQPDGWDYAATVSADDRWLAFFRESAQRNGTFVMPFDGSAPPKRIAEGDCRPTWSSDGRTLWAGTRRHVARYDIETGRAEETLPAAESNVLDLRDLAPELRIALLVNTEGENPTVSAVAVQRAGGSLDTLQSAHYWEVLLASPDHKYAIVSKPTLDTSELVAFALDGSDVIPLSDVPVHATTGNLSPDGGRLVWSTCTPRSAVARLAEGKLVGALPEIGEWSIRHLTSIPHSHRFVALSTRTGDCNPWVLDDSGKEPARMLATPGIDPLLASASPDGWLALQSSSHGIAVMPLDGSQAPRMLTTDPNDASPSFRHGASEVVFSRRAEDGSYQVYSVPRVGGDPVRLIGPSSRGAAAFPTDDRVVYLSGAAESSVVPTVFDPASGSSRPLSARLAPGQWQTPFVSEDGQRVTLILGERELVEVEVASGKVLHRLKPGDALSGGSYSGGWPLFVRRAYRGSLLLADVTWR